MDWKPRPETLSAFRAEGVDASAHVAEFVDHWIAVSGSKGVKLDWEATFRNRIRALVEQGRAKEWLPPQKRGPAPSTEPVGPPSPEQAAAMAAYFNRPKSAIVAEIESKDAVGSPARWKAKT